MADPLPPGPAFIPCVWTALPYWFNMDVPSIREAVGVPPGYIWRDATEGTMAGWVRPSGGNRDDAARTDPRQGTLPI